MKHLRKISAPDWLVMGGLVVVPTGVGTWSWTGGIIAFGVEMILVGLLFGLARGPR